MARKKPLKKLIGLTLIAFAILVILSPPYLFDLDSFVWMGFMQLRGYDVTSVDQIPSAVNTMLHNGDWLLGVIFVYGIFGLGMLWLGCRLVGISFKRKLKLVWRKTKRFFGGR